MPNMTTSTGSTPFSGMSPSYSGECTCTECGLEAQYEEFIIAEGYPDAHTEYLVTCLHCGDINSSLDY